MSKIWYAITPSFCNVTRYAEHKDFDHVYDLVMEITDNHETAASASSWCELASIGEIYEHDAFQIEIIED